MFKENFSNRHIGPNSSELEIILKTIGVESVEELLNQTIPDNIRLKKDLDIPEGISEMEFLNEIKKLSYLNKKFQNIYWTWLPRHLYTFCNSKKYS